MRLEGSCHCGRVRFSCETRHPVPYMRCYCSICRKTGGAGGFMINLAADARTLAVEGHEHVKVYRAMVQRGDERKASDHHRHFCAECGSHLWAHNSRWPDHLHPVASAIDSELPPAPSHVHMMVASKASWVPVDAGAADTRFDEYPDQSIAAWHESHGQVVD